MVDSEQGEKEMWKDPKTDWSESDYFNYEDYNRIKNNIAYLQGVALTLYADVSMKEMGSDKASYADFPYADEFNSLEDNLDSLMNDTFAFADTDKKMWIDNGRTPSYEDLNRLESSCLAFYNGYTTQKLTQQRLSIVLGMDQSTIKC